MTDLPLKSFYSCIDSGFVRHVPQPVQHLVNADKAGKVGAKVIFYTAEDFETLKSQGVIHCKVKEKPDIAGIVFFRLQQFCYGPRPNLDLLAYILKSGYEVHFARENVSLLTPADLERFFPVLFTFAHVNQRDQDRRAWQPVWRQLESAGML